MLDSIGKRAKIASKIIAKYSTEQKNKALKCISEALRNNVDIILKQNEIDILNAQNNNISPNMIDRLMLTKDRIFDISDAILKVIELKDPIGEITFENTLQNGLLLKKVRTPLGVIAIIYEARPNVTVDCAVLCFKTSNAVILRGGKEAINSNKILCEIMRKALKDNGFYEDAIILVEDTTRESSKELMTLKEYVDVLIPRGGKGLIKSVLENATVPTIETGSGNCHIFVDESANIDMALKICDNAKTSRPSVCNAAESLVVHKNIANEFLKKLYNLFKDKNVKLLGCEKTLEIIDIPRASDEDFYTEYNDYIMSVKIVDDVDKAIDFINEHSTNHSEAIITQSNENASKFLNQIDSAAVYVNASTRFTDGFEFGLGAEIGISTQKLHARGPMGLLALTSEKYIAYGNGQVR